MKQINILIKGKVQGVFFRATVKKIADSLNVTGFVQNLTDGSVEIVAQKDQKTLEIFVKTIRENPGNGIISSIETTNKPLGHLLPSFTIK